MIHCNRILTAALGLAASLHCQPVIQNGDAMPGPGYTTTLSAATGVASAGGAGANQIWDFNSAIFTGARTVTVVDPSATPHFEKFPTSNYGWKMDMGSAGAAYFYLKKSADKFETIGSGISVSGGQDFSPNPQTTLKFPFAYGDSVSDTYQRVGGGINPVVATYDGYGTIKLPEGDFQVFRVKLAYSGGSDFVWYRADPLFPVAIYSYSNLALTRFTGGTTKVVNPHGKSGDFRLPANRIGIRLSGSEKDAFGGNSIMGIDGRSTSGNSSGVRIHRAP